MVPELPSLRVTLTYPSSTLRPPAKLIEAICKKNFMLQNKLGRVSGYETDQTDSPNFKLMDKIPELVKLDLTQDGLKIGSLLLP